MGENVVGWCEEKSRVILCAGALWLSRAERAKVPRLTTFQHLRGYAFLRDYLCGDHTVWPLGQRHST
jgi:hypothetical protein